MTNPTWPVSLPQKPVSSGMAGGPQSNRVSFEPEIGPTIDRRRGTAVAKIYDITLPVMTLVQLQAFVDFYEDDLYDGTIAFDWDDPIYGDTAAWKFTGGSYQVSEKAPSLYEVSYKVMRLP